MTIRKTKIALALLVALVIILCLSGCQAGINVGSFSYADSEKYSVGEAELSNAVEHIEIHWLAGNVTVKPHNEHSVSFSEESLKELTDDMKVHYWLDGTTLHIKFWQSGKWSPEEIEKDLTVLVPDDFSLVSLTVRSVSADTRLDAIQAESAKISTISGSVELSDCTVTDSVQVETTSGNVKLADCNVTDALQVDTISGGLYAQLTKALGTFDWDTTSGTLQVTAPEVKSFSASSVSGAVSLSVEKEPEALDIRTTSGSIDLDLPKNASFTLDYDSTSGKLSSDLPHRTESGHHIFGDGKAEYKIGTVSGDVRITEVG